MYFVLLGKVDSFFFPEVDQICVVHFPGILRTFKQGYSKKAKKCSYRMDIF